jgi:uncharacterized membrane protein YfcA
MNVQLIHNIFITLHAAAATLSFFTGCFLVLSKRNTQMQRWHGLYWWSLVGMVVLLAGAILVYWIEYTSVERIIFPGLFVLGLYMLYRARNAGRLLEAQQNNWKHDYIEHISFTLISLFEGFIIVSGLNSGFPGWLVAVLAILGLLLGRWLTVFAQRRVKNE